MLSVITAWQRPWTPNRFPSRRRCQSSHFGQRKECSSESGADSRHRSRHCPGPCLTCRILRSVVHLLKTVLRTAARTRGGTNRRSLCNCLTAVRAVRPGSPRSRRRRNRFRRRELASNPSISRKRATNQRCVPLRNFRISRSLSPRCSPTRACLAA